MLNPSLNVKKETQQFFIDDHNTIYTLDMKDKRFVPLLSNEGLMRTAKVGSYAGMHKDSKYLFENDLR